MLPNYSFPQVLLLASLNRNTEANTHNNKNVDVLMSQIICTLAWTDVSVTFQKKNAKKLFLSFFCSLDVFRASPM